MIEIWSKPQCPFCDKAENLCKLKNFEYKKYMLDEILLENKCLKNFLQQEHFHKLQLMVN